MKHRRDSFSPGTYESIGKININHVDKIKSHLREVL